MPGGRPSKYTPELLEKARKYVAGDWYHYGAQFPSHTGLALYLGVRTTTLYAWEQEEGKEEISDMLREIMEIQHEMLVGHGVTGEFKPVITKLVLTKHGYSDKSELTGQDGKPLIPEQDATETARRALFALAKALDMEKS